MMCYADTTRRCARSLLCLLFTLLPLTLSGCLKNSYTGETLCSPDHIVTLEKMDFPEPVISVAVEPKTKADQEKMGIALGKLAQDAFISQSVEILSALKRLGDELSQEEEALLVLLLA